MKSQSVLLCGTSLIGGNAANRSGPSFCGMNPLTGEQLDPLFYTATKDDLERALDLASSAFPVFRKLSGRERADLLLSIAEGLSAAGEAIVERAHLETGLTVQRLQGELVRTTNQLTFFAEVLQDGSWVGARIDEADQHRKAARRLDVRSMLIPLGPTAIFGASNLPIACSVAGGDTVSALASGNPVIVKAHPAHPGTSELVGRVILEVILARGLPAGIFALLFDAGIDVGIALVQHPAVKAVAFTGSTVGGQALMRLASNRPIPIPCYAEMGSTNPVFLLRGAIKERLADIASQLQASFTLISGQVCTKPGIVFVPADDSDALGVALNHGQAELCEEYGMLTRGIAERYAQAIKQRLSDASAALLSGRETPPIDRKAAVLPAVFYVSLLEFLAHPELEDEVFGPTTLLVSYGAESDLIDVSNRLRGHLTATIQGSEEDLANAGELIRVLETRVGRLIVNGVPTGVDVNHAIVHGGPFPATSDGRSTSIGEQAMLRFTRPMCYQDVPDHLLPMELRRANPLGIMRLVNGVFTREGQSRL